MLPLQLAIGIGHKVGHGAFTLANGPSALNHIQGGFLPRCELFPCGLPALLLQELFPGAAADPAVVITLDRQRFWWSAAAFHVEEQPSIFPVGWIRLRQGQEHRRHSR
jgi:hypothetical protein